VSTWYEGREGCVPRGWRLGCGGEYQSGCGGGGETRAGRQALEKGGTDREALSRRAAEAE